MLLDPSVIHDDDAVGDLQRFFLIMGHEDAGDVDFVVQPAQPPPQFLPYARIERPEWFVEQQHARLDGKRAGERDALPLPAGQLMRKAVGQPVELHEFQQRIDLARNRRVGQPLAARTHTEAEGDVLEDAHVSEQRVMLKDEADVALAGMHAGRVVAVKGDRAGVRRLEAGDDTEQRRLAGAGRPEQRQQLAGVDLEVDAVDGDKIAEALGDAGQLDAHAAPFSENRVG